MTRRFLAALSALILALLPNIAATQAKSDHGQVTQMIVKIMTPDGPKWFILGEEINPVDVTEGKIIEFDYLDDTTEAVEIDPDAGSDAGGAQ